MVRAPCCEKMGLKKGPWTPEEDRFLIAFIQKHGHDNWRALPKQAGLLRCGKSCRLRWMNYLRPDIKRGNFTEEEEETIFNLHEILGNRWSAIAARLPGRTDNEIKNVWHTHLKKKLKDYQSPNPKIKCKKSSTLGSEITPKSEPGTQNPDGEASSSLQRSASDTSSSLTDLCMTFTTFDSSKELDINLEDCIDENSFGDLDAMLNGIGFWHDQMPSTDQQAGSDSKDTKPWEINPVTESYEQRQILPFESVNQLSRSYEFDYMTHNAGDATKFWYGLFTGAAGIEDLLQF